ncbi:hypothetical protein [Burkholderia territorii]|uniref:hypothetical protein n=1 Tax=Burkholderia territorii TaxID=1503055 RepID=UPI001E2859A0|nr:hypothetical protein [Burkholderia territorii]
MNPTKRVMVEEQPDERYIAEDGHELKRSRGTTANGCPIDGRWALYDPSGALMDVDQYRHDLAERCGLDLVSLWSMSNHHIGRR